MSTENITLFFEKAEGSEELQDKIDAITELEQAAQIEALSELSAQEGTPFTVEEFINNVPSPSFSELSEEELAGVAGGRGNKDLAWDFLKIIGKVYKARGRGRKKHKKH